MRWSTFTVLLLMLAALFVVNSLSFAQNTPEVVFAEAQNLKSGASAGVATLMVEKSTVKLGEKFTVDIRFFNSGCGDDFYNTFFNPLIPFPAQLAIYDGDKKYLGDLLAWEKFSQISVTASNWTSIASDSYVGSILGPFTAGNFPPNGPGKIPAGDYYIQMIYNKTYIVANPAMTTDEKTALANFYTNFDRSELFRSNVVQLHFTE